MSEAVNRRHFERVTLAQVDNAAHLEPRRVAQLRAEFVAEISVDAPDCFLLAGKILVSSLDAQI